MILDGKWVVTTLTLTFVLCYLLLLGNIFTAKYAMTFVLVLAVFTKMLKPVVGSAKVITLTLVGMSLKFLKLKAIFKSLFTIVKPTHRWT